MDETDVETQQLSNESTFLKGLIISLAQRVTDTELPAEISDIMLQTSKPRSPQGRMKLVNHPIISQRIVLETHFGLQVEQNRLLLQHIYTMKSRDGVFIVDVFRMSVDFDDL